MDALNDHDVDRVVSLFAPDAVVEDDHELVGLGRIREWANGLVADSILLKDPKFSVDGSSVLWVARQSRRDWRQIGIGDVVTRYRAHVRDGKIVRWTSTFGGPGAQDPAFANVAYDALPVVLLVGTLLAGTTALALSRRRGKPQLARATQGSLLSQLRIHARTEPPNHPG